MDENKTHLIKVAKMAYSENLASHLVEAQPQAQVVALPRPPHDLRAVYVSWNHHRSHRVAMPLLLLRAVLQPPRVHSQPIQPYTYNRITITTSHISTKRELKV